MYCLEHLWHRVLGVILGHYPFIFIMCLFLLEHLKIGNIIFLIIWGEDIKLQSKIFRIVSYYLTAEHIGETSL